MTNPLEVFEIVARVLEYLDIKTWAIALRVCRTWYGVSDYLATRSYSNPLSVKFINTISKESLPHLEAARRQLAKLKPLERLKILEKKDMLDSADRVASMSFEDMMSILHGKCVKSIRYKVVGAMFAKGHRNWKLYGNEAVRITCPPGHDTFLAEFFRNARPKSVTIPGKLCKKCIRFLMRIKIARGKLLRAILLSDPSLLRNWLRTESIGLQELRSIADLDYYALSILRRETVRPFVNHYDWIEKNGSNYPALALVAYLVREGSIIEETLERYGY